MSRRAEIVRSVISMALAVGCSLTALTLAVRANAESDQKWCSVIVLLDEGYNAPVSAGQPELSERGQRLAAAIAERRRTLDCP